MNLFKNNILTKINFIIDNYKTNLLYIKIKNICKIFYKTYILNKNINTFYLTNCLLLLCFNVVIVIVINYLLTKIIGMFKHKTKILIMIILKSVFCITIIINIHYVLISIECLKKDINKK